MRETLEQWRARLGMCTLKETKRHVGDPSVFHVRDRVRLRCDPRHTGTVLAVIHGRVRVTWHETTWVSDEMPTDLERSD